MNKNHLIDAIIEFNPWWKQNFQVEFKPRLILSQIQRFIPTRQIIAFTGLRRVGKTTLLYKIISGLLEEGIVSSCIFYFSFDEFKEINLRSLLDMYLSLSHRKLSENIYLFFDEIQKLDNWQEQIKVLYDIYPQLKIFISGSESLFIKTEKESLSGRIFEFKINTLNFYEFLRFKNLEVKNIELYRKELYLAFEEYLEKSGFPELVEVKDKEVVKKYLQETVIERVIYRDIPTIVKIKNPSLLEELFRIIVHNPGGLLELNDLANDLKISRQTISLYLKYLESSYLIRKLYNFSKSQHRIERKLKKYYPEVFSLNLISKDDAINRSLAFENSIIVQLQGEFFWRDAYKNEVDLVLAKEKEIIPVEIKYGKLEIKGLVVFLKKFNLKKAIVITADKKQRIQEKGYLIEFIPAYEYFYNLSL